MALVDLGKPFGLKKLDFDIHSKDYVTMDAWICLKAMTTARDYIASIGGQIGATSGSSSVSVWRHMTDDEYCTGAIDTPWLRKGYYGGRTEIFHSHMKGDIRGYDINSMYPYCMMAEYPEYLMKDPDFQKAKGIIEATISVPHSMFVAPLPYRMPDGGLRYPIGVFRGTWTYDEVRFAESLGCKVIEVHQAFGCNTLLRPFDEYITTLYRRRKESTNDAERLFLKVLMNSLYGKIASKSEVTRTVSRHTLVKKQDKRLADVKWINPHRGLLDYRTPPPPYVNVCWGAMITANARMLLTRYLLKIPPEKLIYCDTDSVYMEGITLPESKELGGMKLETTAKEMAVIQPKAYHIDGNYKAKGVPKAKRDKDGKIIIDFAKQYVEEGHTEFLAPIRFRASLNSKRGKANQWVPHSRSIKTQYRSKRFSCGRYFPPVIGKQLELQLSPAVSKEGNKRSN